MTPSSSLGTSHLQGTCGLKQQRHRHTDRPAEVRAGAVAVLVDDNPSDLRLYSRALKDAGYRPITTLIGTDYFGIHDNEHPALILLDYAVSSRISAAQTAQILWEVFPSSPTVVFSALTDLPSEMKELVDGFIPKGDTARLIADIRKLLDKGSKGAAARAAD